MLPGCGKIREWTRWLAVATRRQLPPATCPSTSPASSGARPSCARSRRWCTAHAWSPSSAQVAPAKPGSQRRSRKPTAANGPMESGGWSWPTKPRLGLPWLRASSYPAGGRRNMSSRRGWLRAAHFSSSTTASTSSPRAPRSATTSWRGARKSRSWPPAASRSACRARCDGRSRRSATPTRSACSRQGQGLSRPTSRLLSKTATRSPRSAIGSTGCRWRSRWRPLGSTSCRRTSCWPTSTTAFASSPPEPGPCRSGSRRWRRRSTGAIAS